MHAVLSHVYAGLKVGFLVFGFFFFWGVVVHRIIVAPSLYIFPFVSECFMLLALARRE